MAAPTKILNSKQFFSRHGVLSKWHPNYEHRLGQMQMAEAVESALADKQHLIVEAGTGTGKTLAYLIPAIRSGRTLKISARDKVAVRVSLGDEPVGHQLRILHRSRCAHRGSMPL